jgi:hypothetical protein
VIRVQFPDREYFLSVWGSMGTPEKATHLFFTPHTFNVLILHCTDTDQRYASWPAGVADLDESLHATNCAATPLSGHEEPQVRPSATRLWKSTIVCSSGDFQARASPRACADSATPHRLARPDSLPSIGTSTSDFSPVRLSLCPSTARQARGRTLHRSSAMPQPTLPARPTSSG